MKKLLFSLLFFSAIAWLWIGHIIAADGSLNNISGTTTIGGSPLTGTGLTNGNVNAFVIFTNNQVSISYNSSGIFTLTNYAAAGLGFVWSTNGSATNTGNIQSATLNTTGSATIGTTGGASSLVAASNTVVRWGTNSSSALTKFGGIFATNNANGTYSFFGPASAGDVSTAGNNGAGIQFFAAAGTQVAFVGDVELMLKSTGGTTLAAGITSGSANRLATVGANRVGWAELTASNIVSTGTITATNAFLLPTNYVAANFTPVAGYVSIVASNGVLWKVTQLTTNLLSANTP